MRRLGSFPILGALIAAFFVIAVTVQAQTTNAQIVGDILDPSGAAISGANITVTNQSTRVARTVQSNELGHYRVYPVLPGTYDIAVENAGFKRQVRTGVIVEVAAAVKADFGLELGEVSETVEVSATGTVLQTQEASVGGVVTSTQLERLPVNGRNFTRLVLLLPGSSSVTRSQSRGTFSGTNLYAVNGGRPQDNNFTIDGVDSNIMFMNSPGMSPPMDAIQEFKVATNNSAEFGRSAGANVNLVIKSGSRDLHGSAYEYFRNDQLDANDFFANRQGRGKVPFVQNQYGFTLGGPVVVPKYNGRDSMFWFFSWEGFRRRRGATAISTTPIPAQRVGDFSQQARSIYDPLTSVQLSNGTLDRQQFANNRIPEARINPAVKIFLDTVMPLPTQAGLSNNLVNTESQSNDRDMINIRWDYNLGTKDSFFFRYSTQDVGDIAPNANPTLYREQRFDVNNYGSSWNHIFSPTTVLEVRFGYNNPQNPIQDFNRKITREDFIDKTGLKLFQREVLGSPIPEFNAVGEFALGGFTEITRDKVYQWNANLSVVRGSHSFRTGMQYSYRDFFSNTANPMNGNLLFDRRLTRLDADTANTGHSTATMLLGFPTEVRRGQGNTRTEGVQHFIIGHLQDDWRISNKLTINLGLMYQFGNRPYERSDRLGNLWVQRDPQTGQYTGTLLWATTNPEVDPETGLRDQPAKTGGWGRSLVGSDYNDFAPRLGISYRATDKTVIRTGFGVFYNSTFVQELQDLRKFWPFTIQQVFTPNTGVLPDLSATDSGPSFSNTSAIGGWPQNPENRSPYSMQWNFFIQQELMEDLSLEVGYVGSSSKKQIGYTPFNNALTPGPGPVDPRRLLPNFSDLDGGFNMFNGRYDSLQVKAVKRFAGGTQFNANYTWQKALDGQSSLAEVKVQDPFNRRNDYSRSSWDIRHVFNLSYVVELPFGRGHHFGGNAPRAVDLLLGGWAIEGIARAETGAPINVTNGQDIANTGRNSQRPNLVGNPNDGPKTVDQFFNTSAFKLPSAFTYGTAGAFITDREGRISFDVAIQKDFVLHENHRLELRGEFFNLSNTTRLNDPSGNLSSSAFGSVTSATDARQIQLGLRYHF